MKTIIIGIDAATFKLLNPWIKGGELPTISRFIERGSHGILTSIPIPNSIPAWASMITGRSQEKMKSYSLFQREKDSYRPKIIYKDFDNLNPIWNILNKNGISTSILNIPLVHTKEISGVFVKGVFSYSKKSAIPIDLEKKLLSENYFKEDIPSNDIGERLFLKIINRVIDKKINLARYVAKKYNTDFFLFTIIATDALQHLFWKYLDKTHPLYKKTNYEKQIIRIYQKIDKFIKELENENPDATFFIISDHGHSKLVKDVDLNIFLQKFGYQKRKEVRNVDRSDIVNLLIKMKIYFSIYRIIGRIYPFNKIVEKFKKKIEIKDISDFIDWGKTKAYSIDVRGIRINLKGREPNGTINKNEYHKLIEEIKNELLKLKDPDILKRVVDSVDFIDLKKNMNSELGPDIIINFKEGYNNMFAHRKFFDNIFNNPRYWSSCHDNEGIIFVKGKDIKKKFKILDANILDIYPTILFLNNIKIPTNIDGKVLNEMFVPKSELAKRKIVYEDERSLEDKIIDEIEF